MAFKHYSATTASTGGETITRDEVEFHAFTLLPAVPSGNVFVALSMRISGGPTGGEIHIECDRGATHLATQVYSVAANDVVLIDAKTFHEATETITIYSAQDGITVELFGDLSQNS